MTHHKTTAPRATTFLDFLDNLVDASARRDRRIQRRSERWWGNLWVNARLYFRMLYRSLFQHKGTQGPLKGRRIIFLLMFIPVWSIGQVLHWLFIFLDDLVHPAYRQQAVEKPLFIIGNFRCGSTFLQRLMARDRANFATFRMWEIFLAPAVIERHFFRLLVRVDAFFGSPLLRLAHRFDRSTMGTVDIHKVSFFAPEEDENVMLHTWTSSYIQFLFPYIEEIPDYLHFDEALPDKRKRQILFYFERMVQRHLYAHPESRHYLSKSPAFTSKIDCLYAQFPDARMLYLVRNPYEVVASTTSWLSYAWHVFSDCPDPYPFRERILPLCKHYYQDALAKLEAHTPESYLVMRYEDMVQAPETFVRRVYAHFGYAVSPAFAQILREESERARHYESSHQYDLEAMGFDRETIQREFAEIFERFGYQQ